jgi:hypothetical protein
MYIHIGIYVATLSNFLTVTSLSNIGDLSNNGSTEMPFRGPIGPGLTSQGTATAHADLQVHHSRTVFWKLFCNWKYFCILNYSWDLYVSHPVVWRVNWVFFTSVDTKISYKIYKYIFFTLKLKALKHYRVQKTTYKSTWEISIYHMIKTSRR